MANKDQQTSNWEYRCTFVDADPGAVAGLLNDLGAQGWEAVSVQYVDAVRPYQILVTVKRPLASA